MSYFLLQPIFDSAHVMFVRTLEDFSSYSYWGKTFIHKLAIHLDLVLSQLVDLRILLNLSEENGRLL